MDRDIWGAEVDDDAVEKVRPLLAKMLALCEEVDDVASEVCDVDLSTALTSVDVENWLIDALAATRAYEKMRDAQIDERNGERRRARHVPPLSPEEELADTIARQKELDV